MNVKRISIMVEDLWKQKQLKKFFQKLQQTLGSTYLNGEFKLNKCIQIVGVPEEGTECMQLLLWRRNIEKLRF